MQMTEDPEPAPRATEHASPAVAAARLSPASVKRLIESWQDLKMNFAILMAGFPTEAAGLARFETLSERVRTLLVQDADIALYMMLQTATGEVDHYSAHHAMFCAVVSHLCSSYFDWPTDERHALFAAALTMNLGMQALQDSMAKQSSALSQDQRQHIDEHPQQSAELLRRAGVMDPLWIGIVLRHHTPVLDGEPCEPLQASQRLADMLHRVDVFTAKLSRRQTRPAASATVAARDACLDSSGYPDAIGATILRVLGLYPPGSYVRLVNGELAVVTQRGVKAHTPIVACLRRADSAPLSRPARRDTGDKTFAVQRAATESELKMVINHERVLTV